MSTIRAQTSYTLAIPLNAYSPVLQLQTAIAVTVSSVLDELTKSVFCTLNNIGYKVLPIDSRCSESISTAPENRGKWGFTSATKDLGIILDQIKILAQRKKFRVKEKKII